MRSELAQLQISERELEQFSGLDVGEIFVGGVLGGVYRPSALKQRSRLLVFCLTQVVVFVLVIVLSLPIALFITAGAASGISQLPAILKFLQVAIGIALVVTIGWNFYMRFAVHRLKTLMHLLDEVDKYNEVIRAMDLLDQLEMVHPAHVNVGDRDEVLQALSIARESLKSGLMSDRILRENRILSAGRYELTAKIEQNLVALRALEVNQQASEYGQFINEAFQIGLSVHREVQKLS